MNSTQNNNDAALCSPGSTAPHEKRGKVDQESSRAILLEPKQRVSLSSYFKLEERRSSKEKDRNNSVVRRLPLCAIDESTTKLSADFALSPLRTSMNKPRYLTSQQRACLFARHNQTQVLWTPLV